MSGMFIMYTSLFLLLLLGEGFTENTKLYKDVIKETENKLAANNQIQTPKQIEKSFKKAGKQDNAYPACSCARGLCNCCTGNFLQYFRQKACMNVRYIPEDFAFNLAMVLNNRVLYETRLSGKNPPPICINVPRINRLKMCAKIYNIYYSGPNIHFCVNMEGKWDSSLLFTTAFDCIRLGTQGVALVKPEEGGGLPDVSLITSTIDADIDSGGDDIIEEYDENVVRSILEEIMDI